MLNLLYYVTPDWTASSEGANLELWPDGPTGKPVTIVSKFNRLVVMVAHKGSWHSVSRNVFRPGPMLCVKLLFFKEPGG